MAKPLKKILPPAPPVTISVEYQHLTADECESLKKRVRGREKEYPWGSFGPDRDEELDHSTIADLTTQHLENILITQPHISNELAAAILMLLKKRYDKYGADR